MMMSEHRLIPHKPLLVRYVLLRGCFVHYRERHNTLPALGQVIGFCGYNRNTGNFLNEKPNSVF